MPRTEVAQESGPGWAIVRLSSPSGLSRLGPEALLAVTEAVEARLGDPGLAVLALAGSGGSFAVGADLRFIATLTPASASEFARQGARLMGALERAGAAVVAAIDGWCLGGGLDLALACDWRMATRRSFFSHPGPQLGIVTGWGGTQRLPRLVGHRRAAETLLAARRYGADEAHRMGLLQEILPDGGLEPALRARIGAFLPLLPAQRALLKRRS